MPDHAQLGLRARVSCADGTATVWLAGEIDCTSLGAARQAMREVPADTRIIIFDLSEVTFCDCTGVHFLLAERKQAEAAGRKMTVRAPCRAVRRLLELTCTLASLCPDEPAGP